MFERRDSLEVLEGVWSGHYFYPKLFWLIPLSSPVKFTAVFERNGEIFAGRIFEPNTFGSRSAEHLEADMQNVAITGDGVVTFTKIYNGMGNVRHRVYYTGRLSADNASISGNWRISWLGSGTFEIFKEDLRNHT